MEATTLGINRTGAAVSPLGTKAMTDAVNEFAPPGPIDTEASDAQRIVYINESDAIGSIPPPPTVKGMFKSGVATMTGSHPSIFMDKIGERIAFERGGTRLYDALITKYEALSMSDGNILPAAGRDATDDDGAPMMSLRDESPAQTLARIRAEELAHFKMLCEAMEYLGGDPTAQTPCADVIGTASMGLIQVVTDPRTTMAQSLNAMLTAELTDNAGWELLIQLAEDANETELTGRFLGALSQEQEHLVTIKRWVTTLVSEGAGTRAV
jgi:rubrerythrin